MLTWIDSTVFLCLYCNHAHYRYNLRSMHKTSSSPYLFSSVPYNDAQFCPYLVQPRHDVLCIFCKAMTYNILVSRPLKYHLTMRARGYYLLLNLKILFS